MSAHEQHVDRFYRRLAGWCVLRQAVAAVTAWAFLWGTAVLVLRSTQGTPAETLLWLSAGVPVAVALAAWVAVKRLPDRAAVRALLDRRGRCGGLLMAGAERDLGRWSAGVPVGGFPQLRWRAGRPVGLLAVAAAYLGLGFLLPIDRVAAGDNPLDVGRTTDRLGEQVRVLKEEKILKGDRADELRQKLDEVRAQAGGKEPGKTLEALDNLNDVVKQAARKAAESTARQASKLDQIEAAAEALQAAAPALDAKAMAGLMAELSAMTQKAAGENDALDAELGDLVEALKSGKLSAEQLARLAAAAGAAKGKGSKTARKLHAVKLIDADQLKDCEGGKCDCKGLTAFLCKNPGKSLCDALCEMPGRGGVNEGPGAAELQFGDKSSEDGVKFKEEALPPADLAALKESQTTGVSSTAPQTGKGGPTAAGRLNGAAAGGGSANTAGVLPQHKAAVGRYFDRPAK